MKYLFAYIEIALNYNVMTLVSNKNGLVKKLIK